MIEKSETSLEYAHQLEDAALAVLSNFENHEVEVLLRALDNMQRISGLLYNSLYQDLLQASLDSKPQ